MKRRVYGNTLRLRVETIETVQKMKTTDAFRRKCKVNLIQY